MTKVCTLFFLTLLIVFSLGFSFSASAAKPSDFNLKDGDLISAIFSSDPDVYIVNEHGYKRLFLNPEIFKFYGHLGGFAGVKLVTPEVRDSFPTTGLFRNCEVNDLKVYGFQADNEDKGKLHWIDTPGDQAVKDDPDFFKKVFCINDREFRWYPRGQELKSVKEVPQYHRATPATPAVPATPAIPASPSHPFSPTASKSIPLTPSITPKPASGSFSPTPIPTSVAQPATPATPAIPAQPATSTTPTPTPTLTITPTPSVTASLSYSPTPTPTLSMPPPIPSGFPPTRSYPLFGNLGHSVISISVVLYPDSNGDTVKGVFDWGDGTTSEGTAEGNSVSAPKLITPASGGTYVSAEHSYLTIGIYNIKVKAVDATNLSSAWTPSESVTIGIAPAQPVLTVTVSGSDVILNWTESSTDVTGFKLYDMPSSGGWRLPDVGASVRTYTDSGRAPGTYTYYVQAYNLSGGGTTRIYSYISNVVSVTVVGSVTSMNKSNFSRNLAMGSSGNDVKQLQALLVNEVGYSANLITGYFGRITRDAVQKLQEKYGVQPISGYFGEITRRALNALISD